MNCVPSTTGTTVHTIHCYEFVFLITLLLDVHVYSHTHDCSHMSSLLQHAFLVPDGDMKIKAK